MCLRRRPASCPNRLHCASASPDLDAISLPEPDLSIYDSLTLTPMTRDPGPLPGDASSAKRKSPCTCTDDSLALLVPTESSAG